LQELQESIGEVPINNAVAKQEKYDTVDCPDSEHLAVEILAELKRRGVTVNHKITKENINPHTETDKDNDTDSNGAEELFGEEANEEIERNTENKQGESTVLQILQSPKNTSEEEDIHNDMLKEGMHYGSSTANTNLTLNSSSFQRGHRFDLQTNKNSTTEKAESINPAQVAIKLIPHNINLQLGENSDGQVLEHDWNNIVAIIQSSDSTVTQQGQQPTFAIIHATSSNDKSKINVTQINTDNTDKHLQPNVNATLHGELNYINRTFAYNQSENSDATHSTEVYDSEDTAARNNEEMKSNYHSSDATQVPLAPALSPLITNPHKGGHSQTNQRSSSDVANISRNTVLVSHSRYNSSPSGQIFNISEQEHILPNTTNVTHISELNSNNTEAASKVQVPSPLTRLMELYTREGKINLTLQDFWRDLMAKNNKNHTSVINDFITFSQNSSESEDTALDKHKPSALFNTDTIQHLLSALNDTENNSYDAQRQQYLIKLQELATDLVSRKDGPALDTTDHFKFANTTDDSKEATGKEGNN
jgi:formiminotetrahydrofolate cyclodeaminase